MEIACIYGHKRMAPQVGLEPTTLRLTAVRVKTLSAVSYVACRGEHSKSRPQLGYMGYKRGSIPDGVSTLLIVLPQHFPALQAFAN